MRSLDAFITNGVFFSDIHTELFSRVHERDGITRIQPRASMTGALVYCTNVHTT